MKDIVKRAVLERDQLIKRINKLNRFMQTTTFTKISDTQRRLLSHQHSIMVQYRNILSERIYLLQKEIGQN